MEPAKDNTPRDQASAPSDPVLEIILSAPEVAAAVEQGVADVKGGRVTRLGRGQSLSDLTPPSEPRP